MKLRPLLTRAMAVGLTSALMLACGGSPANDPFADGGGGAGGDVAAGGNAGGSGGGDLSLPACVPDGQVEPPHMDITGAVYSVPVPSELEAFASYPIGDVSLCQLGSALQLGYSLPALLVGKKTRVSFQGGYDTTSGRYEMTSADGTASCGRVGADWTCNEAFTGLEIDLTEVAKEAEALPAAEAAARVDVAQLFQGDPIGILSFTLP